MFVLGHRFIYSAHATVFSYLFVWLTKRMLFDNIYLDAKTIRK